MPQPEQVEKERKWAAFQEFQYTCKVQCIEGAVQVSYHTLIIPCWRSLLHIWWRSRLGARGTATHGGSTGGAGCAQVGLLAEHN